MELRQVRGLPTTTITKLQKAGIKTVEQLALVDTRRRKVTGVASDRLLELRRRAQMTIFQKATDRFKAATKAAAVEARKGVESLESLAREAAKQALEAAKEAERAASDALAHAQTAAVDLAEHAASQAVRARKAAEGLVESLRTRMAAKGPKGRQARVKKYWDLVERAENVAKMAAQRATEAAQSARDLGVVAVQETQERGRSLYERLRAKVAGRR